MTIEFPNLSRRYDATRHCVRFSGYDGALEWPFFVEEEALWGLDVMARTGGTALLAAFDRHRDRICAAAKKSGKIPSIYCRDAESAVALAKRGYGFIIAGNDLTTLRAATVAQLKELKS